ncbi:MAG: formate dehydrogenase accessory sulfurtransferase FdhD [Bacteroidota bacterium]
MNSNTIKHTALFFSGENFSETEDILAIEVGLSIAINHQPFTLTMQTPGNELELARGLLFTESIYQSLEQDPSIEILSRDEKGFINAVNVCVDSSLLLKEFAGTRNVMSASSCGMCGKTNMDAPFQKHIEKNKEFAPQQVSKMFEQVARIQKTFIQSGGTHAAGAFDMVGNLLSMQEDIGRHNAVDKVIGRLLNDKRLDQCYCLTVSGRLSYEIVHKTHVAQIPFLASVSAPSSLAVSYAQEAGITLLAFCRNGKLTAYAHPERLTQTLEFKM